METFIGSKIFLVVFIMSTVLFLMRYFAANIYNFLIIKMTKIWYQVVLEEQAKTNRILDIGIGTAAALIKNKKLILQKNLHIVGVDYDQSYIKFAKQLVQKHDLGQQLKVICKSIYDPELEKIIQKQTGVTSKFNSVYFSGSFSLMPDPVKALHVASKLLDKNGLIYITQTYQRRYTPFMATLKPWMKYLTTIDFGELTYEKDLEKILKKSDMDVLRNDIIPGSIDNQWQSARIIVLKP